MSFEIVRQFGVAGWRGTGLPRRRFGVPPNGPWDTESANLVRMLAGLGSEEPVFEVLQGSIEIRLGSNGTLGVVGTDGVVQFRDREYPLAATFPVEAGELLTIQTRCGYLAFGSGEAKLAKLDWRPLIPTSLRFLAIKPFQTTQELTVSRAFSRAGVRLEGLHAEPAAEHPSEPSCVGAIQRTSSGELIIIGPDGPTIGGYPKLGTIIEADLCLVPRLKSGQKVELREVDWSEVVLAREERTSKLEAMRKWLALFG